MANNTLASIKRYEDLYLYFEKRSDQFRVTELSALQIKVERIGLCGNTLQRAEQHPVPHQVLREHYFYGIEVSRPNLVIPGLVIDDVCNHLDIPKNIFAYYAPK